MPLTHKLLGIMLEGFVKAKQRVITIGNRKGLIKFAKGAYIRPNDL